MANLDGFRRAEAFGAKHDREQRDREDERRQQTITFDRDTFRVHIDKVIEATLTALGAEIGNGLDRSVYVNAALPAEELRRRVHRELAR